MENQFGLGDFGILIDIIQFIVGLILIIAFFFYSKSNTLKANELEVITLSNEKELFSEHKIEADNAISTNIDSEQNTEEELIANNINIGISDIIREKNIFEISSENPQGFFVMVGSFANYKNAIKLQKMNPTDFTCHFFEPNYNDLNRVGLFISANNERKAQNALKEIKNMQKQSWLLYNKKN